MSINLTLMGIKPDDLMQDVYFRKDYISLHSKTSGSFDSMVSNGFAHATAIYPIPDTVLYDMETPWGYGGPIAKDIESLNNGLIEWKDQIHSQGVVAEFIRVHPLFNPMALKPHVDMLQYDRETVIVDLSEDKEGREALYDSETRRRLRRSAEKLTVRQLTSSEWQIFKYCYEAGLSINSATDDYYFSNKFYKVLLEQNWSTCWLAEYDGAPVAAACFLHSANLAHFHLSGGTSDSRKFHGAYLLLDHAINHFSQVGYKWMHLGGGRGTNKNDTLLAFKQKFSPLSIPFYIAGIIHDEEKYNQLNGPNSGSFLGYRFPRRQPEPSQEITLQIAQKSDFIDFLILKSEPLNIYWTSHSEPPNKKSLYCWYKNELHNEERQILFAKSNEEVVGYAYLICRGENLFESALGVSEKAAGKGIGRDILVKLCNYVTAITNKKVCIEAWINSKNLASIKAHEFAGYQLDTTTTARLVSIPLADHQQQIFRWIWNN